MKGVIFNLLEQVVVRHHGEDMWDELLHAADLSGVYTSLGSYPDEHIGKLVAAAAEQLQLPPNEVLRWFGRQAMVVLAERYPAFFQPHKTARPFILSVNSIIHPEVGKLYPGALTPRFDFSESEDGLLLRYHSQRRLCALAQGFIEGAAKYYGETASCHHLRCLHNGDSECRVQLRFGS
jgi:hypothetical protein